MTSISREKRDIRIVVFLPSTIILLLYFSDDMNKLRTLVSGSSRHHPRNNER